jgi:isoleucyl-tRNA synthetase
MEIGKCTQQQLEGDTELVETGVDGLEHNFEFYKGVSTMNRWANLEFSAFYMEAIKDRLYTLGEDSTDRPAAAARMGQRFPDGNRQVHPAAT